MQYVFLYLRTLEFDERLGVNIICNKQLLMVGILNQSCDSQFRPYDLPNIVTFKKFFFQNQCR